MAGATSITFTYPLDFVRTRLGSDMGKTTQDRQFTGIIDCVKKIYKSDGLVGLYRGYPPTLCCLFIYRGLYFGMYDFGKEFILKGSLGNSVLIKFFFAQLVVIISETTAYPFDTIRRRMMMQSGQKTREYKSATDCGLKMLKTEGWKSLYLGNSANILRSIGASLVLVLYDFFKEKTAKYLKV